MHKMDHKNHNQSYKISVLSILSENEHPPFVNEHLSSLFVASVVCLSKV